MFVRTISMDLSIISSGKCTIEKTRDLRWDLKTIACISRFEMDQISLEMLKRDNKPHNLVDNSLLKVTSLRTELFLRLSQDVSFFEIWSVSWNPILTLKRLRTSCDQQTSSWHNQGWGLKPQILQGKGFWRVIKTPYEYDVIKGRRTTLGTHDTHTKTCMLNYLTI